MDLETVALEEFSYGTTVNFDVGSFDWTDSKHILL